MEKAGIIMILLILTGCATPYQRIGLSGGYEDTRLGDDLFMVSFRGNGYTSATRVFDMTLRRASEITIENGYSYFTILQSSDTSSTQFYNSGSGQVIGNSVFYNGTSIPVRKAANIMVIKAFKDKPSSIEAIDAATVRQSIVFKYQ